MQDKEKYIVNLEEFKNLIQIWEYGQHTNETRTEINRKLRSAREIVVRAGTLKTFTIGPPPAIGGMIMRNVDPFTCIFDAPYGQSTNHILIDSIEEAIGVIESTEEFTLKDNRPNIKDKTTIISNRVFLVHGRDSELKESTARFLEKLELKPIILHEQLNKGRTIIEKFEDYSDVSFAIVIMTPDDIGAISEEKDNLKSRARQNVVFELGYFIGKLGRKNVVALVKGDIEVPSDYSGVIFIGVDNNDGWKMILSKEIKASGLDIDLNKMLK